MSNDLKTIESRWQATNATRAAAFADPRFGAQWAAEREIETGEAVPARGTAEVTPWADAFKTTVLEDRNKESALLEPASEMRNHPIRRAYVKEVSELGKTGEELLRAGVDVEQVARKMNAERNAAKIKYRAMMTSPEKLAEFKKRNLDKYGDEIGRRVTSCSRQSLG